MAAKGKATITTEEAISMLDLSISGSELEGFESESGSLDGDWRLDGQDENDEQEADESHSGQITAIDHDHTSTQLTDDNDDEGSGSSHRGSHDSEEDDGETSAKLTHAYGGASTSGDYHDSGEAAGETTELDHDSGEVNDGTSQSDPETHTESDREGEETPKSRKRVRRPK